MISNTKTTVRLLATSSIILMLAIGCSTSKDGFPYRTFHNTTSHFNGYFNANELVKKGVGKIAKAQKDDFDQILPLFIYGTEETAKGSYPEMEKAIEKCSRVIDKHEMRPAKTKEAKHPVLNKWMDDNLLLIGQAHFYKQSYYKAENIFNLVSRKYSDESIQLRANTWLARTYIELEEYGKSASALNRIESDAKMDDEIKAQYFLVYADHYLRQEEYAKAAEKLEEALNYIHKKRDRARPLFVLAQVYQTLNRCSEAQSRYKAVEKSRPPYELEFYSKINRAISFCAYGMSSAQIREELMKMLGDEKNEDYKAQIYYALGELELEEQHRPEAIANFEKALQEAKKDPKVKAKTFLRLADLYFEDRVYEQAQAYYDSTFQNIKEDHIRYKEIKARAESLTELVGYLNIIEGNDSIMELCNLGEDARKQRLRKVQKQIEEEIAEQERLEKEAEDLASAPNSGSISGTFWAYNAGLKKKGYENFIDYWGDRKLEDNWRRKNKPQNFEEEEEEIDDGGQTDTADEPKGDKREVPTIDELMAELPCDDAARMAEANASLAEAYYQAGVVYKEKLDDNEKAIESWKALVEKIPDSDFHPTAYYQLFRTYLTMEQEEDYDEPDCNSCSSEYWANEIRKRYPGTEWERLVNNPDYMDIKELQEAEEDSAYQLVYQDYVVRNYPQVITLCSNVISTQPANHLLCKYRLLRAIAVGYTDAPYSIKENYQRELNEVVQNCPDSDEAKRAKELLAAFGQDTSQLKQDEKVEESTGESDQIKPEAESPYKMDEGAEHYFAIILPIQATDINVSKAEIADFNTNNFATLALKVTNNLFDKTRHIILVKPFKTIPEAIDYLGTFQSDTGELGQQLLSQDNTMFVISKSNYITLFKSKDLDQYLQFYNEHY